MDIRGSLAAGVYTAAARVTAQMLGASPSVESVLLHRSVATGEVTFGRSDIDLLMVIRDEDADNGENLVALYHHVRRVHRINPACNHIDVYERDGITRHAETDTCLASTERRSCRLLYGKPVQFPAKRIDPDHAVARFTLWTEWFFAIAVQSGNRRNIRKTALEIWNAYAVAEGLISEPFLRRSDMQAHLLATEGETAVQNLDDPTTAMSLVFDLAARLHQSRLPKLRELREPLLFEAITAPIALRRFFVVLPRADFPPPPDTFSRPGAFPCTPELLHLHMHFKSAYLSWALPADLVDLGMKAPDIAQFLRHGRAYNDDRFLRHPGFAVPHAPGPAAISTCVRHALNAAMEGRIPRPFSQDEVQALLRGVPSIEEYYRNQYPALRREVRALRESLDACSRRTERVNSTLLA